ncbi:MAG: hypothetical protein IZT55_04310, partial [Anaerolineae bacterium]|nr:hypothetical protein [Anaerolineae bacterium]
QLPQPEFAAEELTRAVGHFGTENNGDLTRFIRLETTSSDYMLYTTCLGGDYMLALAFEPHVSFMEMRTQVWELAQKLSSSPQTLLKPVEELPQLGDVTLPPQETEPLSSKSIPPSNDELLAISMDWRSEQDIAGDRMGLLEDLLSARDNPNENGDPDSQSLSTVVPNLVEGEKKPDWTSDESMPDDDLGILHQPAEEPPIDSLMATDPIQGETTAHAPQIGEDQSIELNFEDLEPESASMVNIRYSCVLIPRMPEHHLVGELAEYLSEWVNELSVVYGWRLDHLSVRPNYLYWRAVSPPDYPPASMVSDMKTRISERIFGKFLLIKSDNPSGKFFADGHLIVNGRDKLSQQLMQDFINATRFRQGTRA